MRPPLRLTFGIAAAFAALSLFPSCARTDARADVRPGVKTPAASTAPADVRAPVPVEAVRWGDSDSDGIPDREELRSFGDRESFRKWFASIAEEQFYGA